MRVICDAAAAERSDGSRVGDSLSAGLHSSGFADTGADDDDFGAFGEERSESRQETIERDMKLVLSESGLSARGAWRTSAACRGLKPMLFFPQRNAAVGPGCTDAERRTLDVAAGKARALPEDLCQLCPARAECLSDALHGDEIGVRGGHRLLARREMAATIAKHSPTLLTPVCGTMDGWLRHLRNGLPATACATCAEAVRREGVNLSDSSLNPLARSIGAASDVCLRRSDASEAVPVQGVLAAVPGTAPGTARGKIAKPADSPSTPSPKPTGTTTGAGRRPGDVSDTGLVQGVIV